jgi:DNA-binding MarR family transcriptional regulator
MKKLTTRPAPADDTARTTFVSLMTVFGTAQQLVKDRMRTEQVDGLGPLHLRLLCLCVEQPGGTQQQLANLIGRDKGQVAHLIHALEARGLMARTPDAQDGRLLRMSVTDAGADEAQRFMAIETELAQHLFGELAADEVEQLQALARKLLQRATTSHGIA